MLAENVFSWIRQIDDALCAFCTAFKTPIGCRLKSFVYGIVLVIYQSGDGKIKTRLVSPFTITKVFITGNPLSYLKPDGPNFKVRIKEKSQENGQKRTNTDTGMESGKSSLHYSSSLSFYPNVKIKGQNEIDGVDIRFELQGMTWHHETSLKAPIGPNPKGE
ncbi:hypothetical protein Tco_0111761 [Tanacetum coccineum]